MNHILFAPRTTSVPLPLPDREAAPCLCGEAALSSRRIQARDEFSGERFVFGSCAACGAERLLERPTASAIGGYYGTSYASHTIRPPSVADRVKRLIWQTFYAEGPVTIGRRALRAALWPLRGHTVMAFAAVSPKRLYEFGAATGNDLAVFAAEGWAVGGCEPSPQATEVARARGFAVTTATAEAAEVAPESVSAVLINNVLEHTHDPALVLRKSLAALVPGGSLVVIVPNHAGLSARLFGAAWPGYDVPRHLWGFTPAALSRAMVAAGFEAPVVHHLFQGRWAWRDCLLGSRSTEPVAGWRRRAVKPLSLLLVPLGMAAAPFGYGDFMTVVARKPASV